MTHIINKSGGFGAGGNATNKPQLKKGRTFHFDSFEKAYKFCSDNSIDYDEIIAYYNTYKIEIK